MGANPVHQAFRTGRVRRPYLGNEPTPAAGTTPVLPYKPAPERPQFRERARVLASKQTSLTRKGTCHDFAAPVSGQSNTCRIFDPLGSTTRIKTISEEGDSTAGCPEAVTVAVSLRSRQMIRLGCPDRQFRPVHISVLRDETDIFLVRSAAVTTVIVQRRCDQVQMHEGLWKKCKTVPVGLDRHIVRGKNLLEQGCPPPELRVHSRFAPRQIDPAHVAKESSNPNEFVPGNIPIVVQQVYAVTAVGTTAVAPGCEGKVYKTDPLMPWNHAELSP